MSYRIGFAVVAIMPLIASCAYQVHTNIRPNVAAYSAYDEKIPSKAAAYLDAHNAKADVKVSGLACSAHTFPVDAEASIKTALLGTLENVIEQVQLVDSPLSRSQLANRGLDTMIIAKIDNMDVDLLVIPGFWSADMRSEADVLIGITADNRNGRQFGTTVSGRGKATVNAGSACEGGATAIGKAIEEATENALGTLAERVSNSDRLRRGKGR
jgi:hypothetical protein